VLFSEADTAAAPSNISLHCVGGVVDSAIFSSSDAVKSMASPS